MAPRFLARLLQSAQAAGTRDGAQDLGAFAETDTFYQQLRSFRFHSLHHGFTAADRIARADPRRRRLRRRVIPDSPHDLGAQPEAALFAVRRPNYLERFRFGKRPLVVGRWLILIGGQSERFLRTRNDRICKKSLKRWAKRKRAPPGRATIDSDVSSSVLPSTSLMPESK
jgi:hypothetical protein